MTDITTPPKTTGVDTTAEDYNALVAAINSKQDAVTTTIMQAIVSGGIIVQEEDPTQDSDVGVYAATTSGDLFIKDSVGLFTIAGAYVLDEVIPTVVSATLSGSGGDVFTLVFSEAVTQGSGFDVTDLVVTGDTAGELVSTYTSGDGTDTHVFGLSAGILDTETVTYTWAGTEDGLETATGGDLAEITDTTATNESTLTE